MANLNRITGLNYLIIGRAGMDFYPDPPGTKTEKATNFFACLGGSSANIAVAVNKHGGKSTLVTSVSDDAIGRFVLNELSKYGVNCCHIKAVSGEFRNSLAVVESRIEDHQSVIYRNGAADFEMTIDDVTKINYEQYSALITTGTVFAGQPSRNATFHAFDLAKKKNLPIIFDIDYRPYSWPSEEDAARTYSLAAEMCDVVIGNDLEFGFMAGSYDAGLDKARDLAQTSAQIVIYKMGENGAITITADNEFRTGIYPVEAIKPTGAGDSFMGGFMASLASNYSLEESVKRGSACAAIVVSKVGCAPAMPTKRELDAFLQETKPIVEIL